MAQEVSGGRAGDGRALGRCVRNGGEGRMAFPAGVAQAEDEVKALQKLRMYRHPRVMRVMGEGEQILFDLFERDQKMPGDLPAEWLGERDPPRAALVGHVRHYAREHRLFRLGGG
mgnify:CR=1 FL=1